MEQDKQTIISEIVENELEMFLNVSARGTASCQENPDGFRFYRTAMFETWSSEVLNSYLEDVLAAKVSGRNLVTIKYARMEGLIPVENDNPLIDKIVDIEVKWAWEIAADYPNLQRRGRPIEEDTPYATSTKTYLKGELETYSDKTLECYYAYMKSKLEEGENLLKLRLEKMVQGAGFDSLETAEEAMGGAGNG